VGETNLAAFKISEKPRAARPGLDDEVAFHLAMREQKNRGLGLNASDARYAAWRQFGNAALVKDRSREMWSVAAVETLWRDFLSRLLASQLWRVSVHDPTTITCVRSLLLTTGALACWIPARRATAIEPAMALRHE
jgi:hypothetical protein